MVTMDSLVLPLFPNGTIEMCDHYLALFQMNDNIQRRDKGVIDHPCNGIRNLIKGALAI